MNRSTAMSAAVLVAAILLGPVCQAASPPGLVNYQGVLRSASDKPLDGDHDMVFRFFSAATGGHEILIDRHTAGDSAPVMVSGGLFSVALGSGAVQDGSGSGIYTSLAAVFRDYSQVWLRVEVGGEVLDPRVRVVAAAYALNADHLDGVSASGFIQTSGAPQTKFGQLTLMPSAPGSYGLDVSAPEGAYFEDSNNSGQAWVANGNWGIGGYGNAAGGHFEDRDNSGYADVGIGDYGIKAYGNVGGGSFEDLDNTSSAQVGFAGFGVYASGNDAGGYFNDSNQSGYAYVGYGDYGIEATGSEMGGHFTDSDQSGYAYVANGNWGIGGYGDAGGGYFEDANSSGFARVGWGDYGIYASGSFVGGEFREGDTAAYAFIASDHHGVNAYGNGANPYYGVGVRGSDISSGTYGEIGYWTSSTLGNGEKNFVQNHPYDPTRVIIYASLEGDEVGTYTRGTARLHDGEATVSLGETFKWVTNPDIGLTAHLTPHGDCKGLYVESLTTSELVVRERESGTSDTVFDFVVYGLRIGFEETSRVREKTVESFIPSMKSHQELYEQDPELRRFNSLERFKAMVADARGVGAFDLSRAGELKAAVEEYDPAVHGPVDQLLGLEPPRSDRGTGNGSPFEMDETRASDAERTLDAPASEQSPVARELTPAATTHETTSGELPAGELRGDPIPVSEHVESGQVLALDPGQPGRARAAATMADPAVIGVAVGSTDDTLEARVAASGFVECNVDAGYGAIRAGDLLTTSPTPGHAMRALDVLPGTILGKALEPLEVGTGTIQILVMPR
jgi:hypothetical protein